MLFGFFNNHITFNRNFSDFIFGNNFVNARIVMLLSFLSHEIFRSKITILLKWKFSSKMTFWCKMEENDRWEFSNKKTISEKTRFHQKDRKMKKNDPLLWELQVESNHVDCKIYILVQFLVKLKVDFWTMKFLELDCLWRHNEGYHYSRRPNF